MEPQKNTNLLVTIAEVNNIKINIADFKTIDANPSQENSNGNFGPGRTMDI